MIYDFPPMGAPIRQGDIFLRIPLVDISFKELAIVSGGSLGRRVSWEDVDEKEPVFAVAEARPVPAIVLTQDCDAVRAPYITLCQIKPFHEIEPDSASVTSPDKWQRIITQQARKNQKWFYLPPDEKIGFQTKMGVTFLITIRVFGDDLKSFRRFRKGTLNETARAHFRERIAEFYRRYPYDEWYPLDKQEMQAYVKHHGQVAPYPYQL